LGRANTEEAVEGELKHIGGKRLNTPFPLKYEVVRMTIKKRSKPKKRAYKSRTKGSAKPSWKKQYRDWESTEGERPKRITVENSCWRFE